MSTDAAADEGATDATGRGAEDTAQVGDAQHKDDVTRQRLEAADELIARYRTTRPQWSRFVDGVLAMIRDYLSGEHLMVVAIEGRSKSEHSYARKILASAQAALPGELHDRAAFRIITLFQDDKERVVDLVRALFGDDRVQVTGERGQLLAPWEFAYRSIHLKVTVAEHLLEGRGIPAQCAQDPFEIQVRSATEHIWAATDHKLRYKAPMPLPGASIRSLFRLAALLETVDDELTKLQRSVQEVLTGPGTDLWNGQPPASIPATTEAVRALIATDPSIVTGLTRAVTRGWELREPVPWHHADAHSVETEQAKVEHAAATDLALICEKAGIGTLGQLREALESLLNDDQLVDTIRIAGQKADLGTHVHHADFLSLLLLSMDPEQVPPAALTAWSDALADIAADTAGQQGRGLAPSDTVEPAHPHGSAESAEEGDPGD